jgi:hypothetical protein
MTYKIILNAAILILMYFIISIFSLDVRIPYPKSIIVAFNKDYVKLLSYIAIYFIAYYNPVISITLLVFIVILHSNDVMLVNKM